MASTGRHVSSPFPSFTTPEALLSLSTSFGVSSPKARDVADSEQPWHISFADGGPDGHKLKVQLRPRNESVP
jgi:hypothetical protein